MKNLGENSELNNRLFFFFSGNDLLCSNHCVFAKDRALNKNRVPALWIRLTHFFFPSFSQIWSDFAAKEI